MFPAMRNCFKTGHEAGFVFIAPTALGVDL